MLYAYYPSIILYKHYTFSQHIIQESKEVGKDEEEDLDSNDESRRTESTAAQCIDFCLVGLGLDWDTRNLKFHQFLCCRNCDGLETRLSDGHSEKYLGTPAATAAEEGDVS